MVFSEISSNPLRVFTETRSGSISFIILPSPRRLQRCPPSKRKPHSRKGAATLRAGASLSHRATNRAPHRGKLHLSPHVSERQKTNSHFKWIKCQIMLNEFILREDHLTES